ncbi:MAG: hypothetical protein KBC08_00900 [Caldisericia bacterium]|nr:hypothetical protein [Caldisericia bacterium]
MKTKFDKLPKGDSFVWIIVVLAVVFAICFIFVPQDKKQYNDIVSYFFSAAPQTMGAILGIALSALYIMIPNLAKGALSEPLKKLLFSDYCLKNSVKFGLVPISSIIFIPFSSLKMPLIVEKISISLSLSLVFACGILSIYYLTKFITDRYELYSNYRKMLNSDLNKTADRKRNILLIELKILLFIEGKEDDEISTSEQDDVIKDILNHLEKWDDIIVVSQIASDIVNSIKNNKKDISSSIQKIYYKFTDLIRKIDVQKNKSFEYKKNHIDDYIDVAINFCYHIVSPRLENSIGIINKIPEDLYIRSHNPITNYIEFLSHSFIDLFDLKMYFEINKKIENHHKDKLRYIASYLKKLQDHEKERISVEVYQEYMSILDKLLADKNQ